MSEPKTGDPCAQCGEPIPDMPTGTLCLRCHSQQAFPTDERQEAPGAVDHPWDLRLAPTASVHTPCCDRPQAEHPSVSWNVAATWSEQIRELTARLAEEQAARARLVELAVHRLAVLRLEDQCAECRELIAAIEAEVPPAGAPTTLPGGGGEE